MPSRTEPVEVLAAWAQTGELDMHAVRRFRDRGTASAPLDLPELHVGSELPLHLDRARGHSSKAVLGYRTRCKPGPEHHAVRGGIARGHSHGEGIAKDLTTVPCPRSAR